jgi:hypothetical protein
MRFVPTRLHGVLDYLAGLLLILAPWLLDFGRGGAETVVPLVVGPLLIVYSLATDYELGMGRLLPVRLHLWLDAAAGLLLATSPWLFGFAGQVVAPHLAGGLALLALAAVTVPTPDFCSMRGG